MGMPITVDIPLCENEDIFEEIFNRFRAIDSKFSPYKNTSELSKYQHSEISDTELSFEFKKVMDACKKFEQETDGFFTAFFLHKYDPTGYVKGYAIAEAGRVIEQKGYSTFCVGAGGDILARSDSDKVWHIGIQDPKEKQKLAKVIEAKNLAVATSGNYERGKHIFNPKTGKPADKFLSVTVTGPDIVTADVLATAIFASGQPELIDSFKNYELIIF
jgi:thiamine biosynthesis lipoprotein